MPRGVTGSKKTVCKCRSDVGVDSGLCLECRREYGRAYYRRKLAKNAATGGPLVPREKRGFCSGRKKQKSPVVVSTPRVDFGVPLAPYIPIVPVTLRGRRIPPADASMAEKLACPEWVAHYERDGLLGWARRQ